MYRFVTALALAGALFVGSPLLTAAATEQADFDVAGGHFYTQANGTSAGASAGGFSITDANGIPFWTYFSGHGGPDLLGYPISSRFVWDGYVCQATQRAILQWDPTTQQVQEANLFDYLSNLGKDSWLAATHLAPPPQQAPQEAQAGQQPLSFLMRAHYRFNWLYSDPAVFHRYFNTPEYYSIYGLPTSPVEDLGPYLAERFQRMVIYHWKIPVPFADERGVSIGLGGDLFKEMGLVPTAAIRPAGPNGDPATTGALPVIQSPVVADHSVTMGSQIPTAPPVAAPAAPTAPSAVQAAPVVPSVVQIAPAAPSAAPAPAPSGLPVLYGVATWYGDAFQGQVMSNGQVFNMYDPTTTAANAYPLGTVLRVTRLTTGKSILVRVTDRGAFRYPDLVDLSYAAFSELADPATGVIAVRVEPA